MDELEVVDAEQTVEREQIVEKERPAASKRGDWESFDNVMILDKNIDLNENLTDEQWQTIKETSETRGVDVAFRLEWLPKNGYEVTRENMYNRDLHANGVIIKTEDTKK